jgi:hypothetical protein
MDGIYSIFFYNTILNFCVFPLQFRSLFFGSVYPPGSPLGGHTPSSQKVLASDSEDDG